jgi:hypothetical protein
MLLCDSYLSTRGTIGGNKDIKMLLRLFVTFEGSGRLLLRTMFNSIYIKQLLPTVECNDDHADPDV